MRLRKGHLLSTLGTVAVVAALATPVAVPAQAQGGGKPKLTNAERKRLRLQ